MTDLPWLLNTTTDNNGRDLIVSTAPTQRWPALTNAFGWAVQDRHDERDEDEEAATVTSFCLTNCR